MRFQPLVLALGAAAQFVPNTATSGTAVESTEMDAMNQRFNNYLVNPKKYEPDYQAVISDRILGIIGSMEELQKLVPATAGIFNESITVWTELHGQVSDPTQMTIRLYTHAIEELHKSIQTLRDIGYPAGVEMRTFHLLIDHLLLVGVFRQNCVFDTLPSFLTDKPGKLMDLILDVWQQDVRQEFSMRWVFGPEKNATVTGHPHA